ncbi:acyltransferase [Liquorilactobacillus sicerae]|uniref:acyltransferase n=1 Tax=Liquorilactobacillus sicerae TaxID=1416943 RepID=UPI002481129E|nr:acyltransferase [Liquorilactobacillus sicerae]
MPEKKRAYLYEVDFMRVFFICGVLANHTTSAFTDLLPSQTVSRQFLLSTHLLLHFPRFGFMFITGLVLFWQHADKKLDIKSFLLKRFSILLVPYLFWITLFSFLQTLASSNNFSFFNWLVQWWQIVIHGNKFYLYYLFVLFQLYLVFPLLLKLFEKTSGHHLQVLQISFVIQLLMTIYFKYFYGKISHSGWPYLIRAYGNFVLSYQFYFIAGAFCALHYQYVKQFITKFSHWITFATLSLGVGTIGLYYFNTAILGLNRHHANLIHQPYILFYASLVILQTWLIGIWYADKRRHSKSWNHWITNLAECSFGIYLVQLIPLTTIYLLIQYAKPTISFITLIVLLPLAYVGVLGISWALTNLLRKKVFLKSLIGRKEDLHYE